MNNVIKFPGTYHHRPGNGPLTIEEIQIAKQDVSTFHVEEASSDLIEYIMTTLPVYGFNIQFEQNGEFVKNLGLLIESLRALLFKYHGIDHPLHVIAEELFTEISPGILSIKEIIKEPAPTTAEPEEIETNT